MTLPFSPAWLVQEQAPLVAWALHTSPPSQSQVGIVCNQRQVVPAMGSSPVLCPIQATFSPLAVVLVSKEVLQLVVKVAGETLPDPQVSGTLL